MEDNEDKIRIERIWGISSVTSNAQFDCDSNLIAYPAGNTVVILDTNTGNPVSHVILETRKPISTIQLKNKTQLFVTTEESNFLRLVNWESGLVKDISPCQNVVCSAVSSKLGVLVTVGSDRVVSVWDYKGLTAPTQNNKSGSTFSTGSTNRARKVASSSVACKVSCVAFSPDGNFFVTGGTRHLKFWYLQCGKNEYVLTGRPAILGSEHSNADFRDVTIDESGSATYAIANFSDGAATSSTLCQFDDRRFLDKWVQLKTKQAFCIANGGDQLLFIGCADGIIRCFRSGRLDFVATLPLPHHLGVDIAKATDVSALSSHPQGSKFPNVVAIRTSGDSKVAAIYSDHSLYIWSVQDIKRIGLSHSWLWHSGCIWDIEVGSVNINAPEGSSQEFYKWPYYVTCSNDDTLRTWNHLSQTKTNLYSNECTDIKYISTRYLDSPLFISHGNGVRCIGIGSNFICCGDRQGNLRFCKNKSKNELIKIKAHKEEILSLDVFHSLVASGGRDGNINLYNIGQEIEKISTLQEHSGSVTSVKFLFSEKSNPPSLYIISCGADKNLIFRKVFYKKNEILNESHFSSIINDGGEFLDDFDIQVTATIPCKTPLFDLEIDTSKKHVLVACQDACIRVFNVSTGKQSKTLRNSYTNTTNLGTIIKVVLDPSGYYIAAASTDKTITIFDFYKGDVVSTLMGHSELATAIRFTPDFKQLISVAGDSCIFVWSLPREMVVTMEARMSEKRSRMLSKVSQSSPPSATPTPFPNSSSSSPYPASPSPSKPPDYKFKIEHLPDWAKKQMKGGENQSSPKISKSKPSAVTLPQGKWSERVEQVSAMTIKSFYHSDTVVPVPFSKSQASPKEIPTIEREIQFNKQNAPININNNNNATTPTIINNNNNNEKESNSYEACDESYQEIEGDDEGCSTDFYSDLNKSTDGEADFPSRSRNHRSDETDDTDESSSTKSHNRKFSRLKMSTGETHPFEIVKSRNAELIMSVKAKNREISKSRLELEKRLEDTRRKLQSIGYKSMSMSTNDLSRSFVTNKEYQMDDTDDDNNAGENGMRRACSLSDLNALPTSNNNSSNSTSAGRRKRSFHKHRNEKSRTGTTGVFDPQNILTRSTSVSALITNMNQSDSETESLPVEPSYMSKTIATQNKSRKKPSNVVLAFSQSQENLRDGEVRMRVSASEQNLNKIGMSNKSMAPIPRSKMNTPNVKKPQQVAGISRGGLMTVAAITGVRQEQDDIDDFDYDNIQLTSNLATSSVDALKKSLEHVIDIRRRVQFEENLPDQGKISRILEDGLRNVQRNIQESVRQYDNRPKIITEHEATLL